MSYAEFTFDTLASEFGVTANPTDLFPSLAPVSIPAWLRESLERGTRQVLLTEKARSEFIVCPVLLACQEISATPVSIYSGQRLDVDPERGLVGEWGDESFCWT